MLHKLTNKDGSLRRRDLQVVRSQKSRPLRSFVSMVTKHPPTGKNHPEDYVSSLTTGQMRAPTASAEHHAPCAAYQSTLRQKTS